MQGINQKILAAFEERRESEEEQRCAALYRALTERDKEIRKLQLDMNDMTLSLGLIIVILLWALATLLVGQ